MHSGGCNDCVGHREGDASLFHLSHKVSCSVGNLRPHLKRDESGAEAVCLVAFMLSHASPDFKSRYHGYRQPLPPAQSTQQLHCLRLSAQMAKDYSAIEQVAG